MKDTVGDNQPNDYKWIVDGSVMNFTNWAGNNPGFGHNCVTVVAYPKFGGKIGQWDNQLCTITIGGVCETDKK